MTDADIDLRLAALFAEPAPAPDPAFAYRIVALAAYDLAQRRSRTRMALRMAREAVALGAVLAAFALLARLPGEALAGLGDSLPLASPAMIGVALLALWVLVGGREAIASS